MALERYDPPGFLKDFDAIPDQLDAWSAAVSGWFDGNIALVEQLLAKGEHSQFYNAVHNEPAGPVFDQVLAWNGLPATYRNRFGRAQAFELADQLLPLTQRMDGPGSYYVGPQWSGLYYRPQDEYCEWHVSRDPAGRIAAVTFTSEPPEFWQALHGDTLPDVDGNPAYRFPGDRDLLCSLYRQLVSPAVQYEDLICAEDLVDHSDPNKPVVVYPKGSYNPYNKWNTTDGIVHLTHPANSLAAEINLGAVATVLRQANSRPVTDPDALICCARYGGANRASDPTIGSSVNELAALGAAVTLRNPVGLAMHHLNLAGFATPDGSPVTADYFTVLRGDGPGGLIERAVFAVPEGLGFTVSDLTVGGIPIRYGGQIAEHMTVNLVGRATAVGSFDNSPLQCESGCCQDDENGNYLMYRRSGTPPCLPTASPAFTDNGPTAVTLLAARPAAAATRVPHRRHTRVV